MSNDTETSQRIGNTDETGDLGTRGEASWGRHCTFAILGVKN